MGQLTRLKVVPWSLHWSFSYSSTFGLQMSILMQILGSSPIGLNIGGICTIQQSTVLTVSVEKYILQPQYKTGPQRAQCHDLLAGIWDNYSLCDHHHWGRVQWQRLLFWVSWWFLQEPHKFKLNLPGARRSQMRAWIASNLFSICGWLQRAPKARRVQ